MKEVKEILQLLTDEAFKDFIGNDGLENLEHQNTTTLKNNHIQGTPIYVDAYTFSSYGKHCYIAFRINPINKKWIIKSLHLDKGIQTIGDLKIGKLK